MFDLLSFIMGLKKGKTEATGTVVLEGTDYTFTDANSDGNIEITENGGE